MWAYTRYVYMYMYKKQKCKKMQGWDGRLNGAVSSGIVGGSGGGEKSPWV